MNYVKHVLRSQAYAADFRVVFCRWRTSLPVYGFGISRLNGKGCISRQDYLVLVWLPGKENCRRHRVLRSCGASLATLFPVSVFPNGVLKSCSRNDDELDAEIRVDPNKKAPSTKIRELQRRVDEAKNVG